MAAPAAARALALAAALSGVAPTPAPPSAKPVRALSIETAARVPLAQARDARGRFFIEKPAGLRPIAAAVAADAGGALWIRLRRGKEQGAWPWEDVKAGLRWCPPSGCLQISADGSAVIASPEGEEGQARFDVASLVERAHAQAPRASLEGLVDYAVVAEPGPRPPACVVLWRRDADGQFWITHLSMAELAGTVWLVSINGLHYGLRLAGDALLFERRAPNATSAGTAAPEAPLRLP